MNKYFVTIFSGLWWTLVYYVAKLLLPKVLPQYSKWDNAKKYQARGLIPSTFFIIISVSTSSWILIYDQALNDVRTSGSTDLSMAIISTAFGYFIFDSIIVINHLEIDGFAMLAHGVLCMITYGLAVTYEVYQAYGPVFLVFEASTIFLNLRW